MPLVLALGCVSTTDGVRARFAKEQSCPEARVDVQSEGDVYRVSGCGKRVTYICPGPHDKCTPRGQYKQAAPGPYPPPNTYPPQRGRDQPHIER